MLFKSWIQNIGNINFPNICFKDTTAESSEMHDDEIGPITIVMLSAVIIVDDNSVIENHDGEENEGQKKNEETDIYTVDDVKCIFPSYFEQKMRTVAAKALLFLEFRSTMKTRCSYM